MAADHTIAALGDSRAIVIAQYSMERVIEQAMRSASVPVLGSATEGVKLLRRLVEGG